MKNTLLTFGLSLLVALSHAQIQMGKASFYADSFEGNPTASGEKFNSHKLTAAHKTLPFGSLVKVTNVANNRSVKVTINDRGPYVNGRIIDLSKSAAKKLGFINKGLADVKVEIINAGNGKSKTHPVIVDVDNREHKEYYQFIVRKSTPKGYGAQLGTYQELTNLFRVTNNVQTQYKMKTTIEVKLMKGIKYYSLIIGPFSSKAKAGNFVVKVKPQFPDAYVLDFPK